MNRKTGPSLIRIPRSLQQNPNLKYNTRLNPSKVRYECNYCQKVFLMETNLKLHQELHQVVNDLKSKFQHESNFTFPADLNMKILKVLRAIDNNNNLKMMKKKIEQVVDDPNSRVVPGSSSEPIPKFMKSNQNSRVVPAFSKSNPTVNILRIDANLRAVPGSSKSNNPTTQISNEFKCDLCKKIFLSQDGMKQHQKSFHLYRSNSSDDESDLFKNPNYFLRSGKKN